jgi:hypothetical protein
VFIHLFICLLEYVGAQLHLWCAYLDMSSEILSAGARNALELDDSPAIPDTIELKEARLRSISRIAIAKKAHVADDFATAGLNTERQLAGNASETFLSTIRQRLSGHDRSSIPMVSCSFDPDHIATGTPSTEDDRPGDKGERWSDARSIAHFAIKRQTPR